MIRKRVRKVVERKNTRVDFTPMVDMNMLLLTFFMFCTTLSKPQILDLAMPVPTDTNIPDAPASLSLTFILSEKDKLFYYEGMPNYEDYTSLKEISYAEVRGILAQKNKHIIEKVEKLRTQLGDSPKAHAILTDSIKEFKRQKNGAVAIIKPTENSNYSNLVDILDEMAICNVGRYSVDDLKESDHFLIANYEAKGEHSAK